MTIFRIVRDISYKRLNNVELAIGIIRFAY